MKKLISVILAGAMLFALGACTCMPAAQNTENTAPAVTAGGWVINPSATDLAAIPEEPAAAFALAAEGKDVKPVAYLGSQVVAGLNYSYVCISGSDLCTAVVYKDLEGNATFTSVKPFNISDFNTASNADLGYEVAGLAGGWMLTDELSGSDAVLPADVKTAFDKAMGGLLGVNYEPVAYLGSQLVAGHNYAVLCKASVVSAEPASAMTVIIIYADLQGNASLLSINPFPIHN